MEIREATIDDFDQVKGIKLKAKASERRYNKSLKPLREARKKYFSYLKTDLANKDAAVLIATDRDRPVGIITGRIYKTLPIKVISRKGHISNLFVASSHRNKGIATRLVRELLNWFQEKKIRDVHLGVHSRNDRALEVFRKLKFRESIMEMKIRLGPGHTASGLQ